MTRILLHIVCLLSFSFGIAQEKNNAYDPTLAQNLGADEYGMKNYFLVLLQTGSSEGFSKDEITAYFQSHMQNISKHVASKKLIVAGPVGKNEEGMRGVFILDVSTEEEVKQILQEDGAVASGLLKAVIMPWYGSAALPTYMEVHSKVQKKSF